MHYLSEYQTFQSKQQLNETIAEHVDAHHYDLTETVRNVLTVISRYAVKFPGVAHLKAATIAQAIDMSEKTVRRALNRLQSLGIIKKVKTTRKVTGGQGANIIVVLPLEQPTTIDDQAQMSTGEQAVEPMAPSVKPSENATEPYSFSKLNNLNSINTYSAKPSTPYIRFKTLVQSYVDDSKLTNRLYGIYLAHTSYLRNAFNHTDLLNTGLHAIKATFQASKRKSLRNIAGYFNGTLDRMLDRLYYQSIFEEEME